MSTGAPFSRAAGWEGQEDGLRRGKPNRYTLCLRHDEANKRKGQEEKDGGRGEEEAKRKLKGDLNGDGGHEDLVQLNAQAVAAQRALQAHLLEVEHEATDQAPNLE